MLYIQENWIANVIMGIDQFCRVKITSVGGLWFARDVGAAGGEAVGVPINDGHVGTKRTTIHGFRT